MKDGEGSKYSEGITPKHITHTDTTSSKNLELHKRLTEAASLTEFSKLKHQIQEQVKNEHGDKHESVQGAIIWFRENFSLKGKNTDINSKSEEIGPNKIDLSEFTHPIDKTQSNILKSQLSRAEYAIENSKLHQKTYETFPKLYKQVRDYQRAITVYLGLNKMDRTPENFNAEYEKAIDEFNKQERLADIHQKNPILQDAKQHLEADVPSGDPELLKKLVESVRQERKKVSNLAKDPDRRQRMLAKSPESDQEKLRNFLKDTKTHYREARQFLKDNPDSDNLQEKLEDYKDHIKRLYNDAIELAEKTKDAYTMSGHELNKGFTLSSVFGATVGEVVVKLSQIGTDHRGKDKSLSQKDQKSTPKPSLTELYGTDLHTERHTVGFKESGKFSSDASQSQRLYTATSTFRDTLKAQCGDECYQQLLTASDVDSQAYDEAIEKVKKNFEIANNKSSPLSRTHADIEKMSEKFKEHRQELSTLNHKLADTLKELLGTAINEDREVLIWNRESRARLKQALGITDTPTTEEQDKSANEDDSFKIKPS